MIRDHSPELLGSILQRVLARKILPEIKQRLLEAQKGEQIVFSQLLAQEPQKGAK